MPTMRSLREAISTSSPILRPSVLDTATSSGVDGGRPSDTAGMPGPRSGAPNRSTLRVESPSVAVPPAYDQRGRRVHAWGGGDPAQVHRRERRRPDERAGRAGLDEEHVDAERIDGLVGLDPEPVGEPGENERHREDDGGGQDRDDETPFSPLHVAQRGQQHVGDVTDAWAFAGRVLAMTVLLGERRRPGCCRTRARSSGLRLDTNVFGPREQSTTSSSTQLAPALTKVGFDARPRRDRPAAHHVGLDQRPRSVADHRNGLARVEETPGERDRRGVGAQEVGIGDAAGQHQRGVVGCGNTVGRLVGLERVGWRQVVERLDLADFCGHQFGCAAGLFDGLPRFGQFDLLDAFGSDQERNRLAVQ